MRLDCRCGKKLTGRWRHRHDTGPNRQVRPDAVPFNPQGRRLPQSISRSRRCCQRSIGPDCQWNLPEDVTSAPAVAPPSSSAATVIVAIATAPRRVRNMLATMPFVPPVASTKQAGAAVTPMLNGNAAIGPN